LEAYCTRRFMISVLRFSYLAKNKIHPETWRNRGNLQYCNAGYNIVRFQLSLEQNWNQKKPPNQDPTSYPTSSSLANQSINYPQNITHRTHLRPPLIRPINNPSKPSNPSASSPDPATLACFRHKNTQSEPSRRVTSYTMLNFYILSSFFLGFKIKPVILYSNS
jgi:hypothetical protein